MINCQAPSTLRVHSKVGRSVIVLTQTHLNPSKASSLPTPAMPVPTSTSSPPLLPPLTRADIDAARTSAWYDTFEDLTTPATVISIDALGERPAFLEWIESESIFIPEDAQHASHAPQVVEGPKYHLPKLNAAIREAIAKYGAVFPKLNWTSPRVRLRPYSPPGTH